jgi:nitroreductase
MNATISSELLLNQLQWRYATKTFDSTRQIPEGSWQALERALILTPSAYGLQPWKFFVVTNRTVREQLLPASWGQRQIVDAPRLVVFAIKNNLAPKDVDRYVARIAELRNMKADSLSGFRDMMMGFVSQTKVGFDINAWSARQAYIALGNFMTAAALLGIDTCPMEGFEPAKYDEILGLNKLGYSAVVLCAAGFRSSEDQSAGFPKVRFEKSEVLEQIA